MKKLVLEQTKSIVDSQVVFTTAVQEAYTEQDMRALLQQINARLTGLRNQMISIRAQYTEALEQKVIYETALEDLISTQEVDMSIPTEKL